MSRKLNLKMQILEAAKEIAAVSGVEKLNMRGVAQKSNIALGSIYNYYPSKESLITSLIEDFWKSTFDEMNFSVFKTMPYLDAMEKFYKQLFTFLNQFKGNWVEQLILLDITSKGEKVEKEYLTKIQFIISFAIEQNEKAMAFYTYEEQKVLGAYILDNMMDMLKKGQEDFTMYRKILGKILMIE